MIRCLFQQTEADIGFGSHAEICNNIFKELQFLFVGDLDCFIIDRDLGIAQLEPEKEHHIRHDFQQHDGIRVGQSLVHAGVFQFGVIGNVGRDVFQTYQMTVAVGTDGKRVKENVLALPFLGFFGRFEIRIVGMCVPENIHFEIVYFFFG